MSPDDSTSSATAQAVTSTAESDKAAYKQGEELPVGSYRVLLSVYGAGVAAFLATLKITGRTLPERVPFGDIALMGVATHKLARLLAKDKVTSAIRAPFIEFDRSIGSGEVMEKPRGSGAQRALGELLACPFCLAQWIATGFSYGTVFAPRLTRLATGTMTAVAAADFLQYAYVATQRAVE